MCVCVCFVLMFWALGPNGPRAHMGPGPIYGPRAHIPKPEIYPKPKIYPKPENDPKPKMNPKPEIYIYACVYAYMHIWEDIQEIHGTHKEN